MCTVNDDGISNMVKVKEIKINDSDVCRKCQSNKAEVVLREKDVYCNSCFLIYFVHKFRSTIGKSKEIKPGDKILIGVSGGLSSMALLHLTHHGLNENTSKRLRYEPHVLFIDESTFDDSFPSVSIISKEVTKLKFPFYSTNFEEVVKDGTSEISVSTSVGGEGVTARESSAAKRVDLVTELNELLMSHLTSGTSRKDMIFHLRNELICRCAKQLGFKKVFLGTNGSELAVRILSDIALGRGSQLADHVQFKGTQFGVQLFRPLRELFNNEIEHYIKCQDISIPNADLHSPNKEINSNIVSCTRNFISGLQRDFLSTVPTILRTGGKLVNGNSSCNESTVTMISENSSFNADGSIPALEDAEDGKDICLFCGLRMDTSENAVCALAAIKISKKLSALQPPVDDNPHPIVSMDIYENDESHPNTLTDEEIYKYFCYGCANLFHEMGSVDHFPTRVQRKLRERRQEDQTLKLIQDCLI